MATYRQIHTHIWDDPIFEELTPAAKLIFIHGFSNKHRNEAGLYVITVKKMAFETGLTLEQANDAVKELVSHGRWEYDWDNHVLWIKNALKYQSIGKTTLIAINKDLDTIVSPLKSLFIEYYKDILYPTDTLPIPQPTPTDTLGDKDKGNGKGNGKGKGNDLSLEIEQFRSRYSPEQLSLIDQFFEILRTTRVAGKIALSVEHGVYEDMHKYDPLIVEYACTTVIKRPDLHAKKENYFAGILRNTTIDEALKGLHGGRASPKNKADDIINQYCGEA